MMRATRRLMRELQRAAWDETLYMDSHEPIEIPSPTNMPLSGWSFSFLPPVTWEIFVMMSGVYENPQIHTGGN